MPGKRYEEATTSGTYIPEGEYSAAALPTMTTPEGEGWVLKAAVPMPVDRHGHMDVVFYWQRDVTPPPKPQKKRKMQSRLKGGGKAGPPPSRGRNRDMN